MARRKDDSEYVRDTLVDLLKTNMGAKEARTVVNNHYGEAMERRNNPPSGGGNGGGGVMSRMGNKSPDDEAEDPFDYYVNIDRTDKYDKQGEKVGWIKNVHRSRQPKDAPKPKKKRA